MQKITAKGQMVWKIEWKQMDGQMDGGDCITSRANVVGSNYAPGIGNGSDYAWGAGKWTTELLDIYYSGHSAKLWIHFSELRTKLLLTNFRHIHS